jgi:anti-sigma factor RsiW
MKCNEILDKLVLYSEGELDARDTAEIDRHLRDCPKCRQRLEKLQALRKCITKNLMEPILTPDMSESIMADLPKKATPAVRRWSWSWAAASAAVLAVIAICAILMSLHNGKPELPCRPISNIPVAIKADCAT